MWPNDINIRRQKLNHLEVTIKVKYNHTIGLPYMVSYYLLLFNNNMLITLYEICTFYEIYTYKIWVTLTLTLQGR